MESIKNLRLRLRLTSAHGLVMGPGRADLLALIAQTGSIAAAGRQMNMSYKRAWTLVEAMNHTFTGPLVETSKGGAGHGGARLTELGVTLLQAYRELEKATKVAGIDQLDLFESVLEVPPVAKPS